MTFFPRKHASVSERFPRLTLPNRRSAGILRFSGSKPADCPAGLRIKENKEVYEGEVTELTPEEMETEGGGYGKVRVQAPRGQLPAPWCRQQIFGIDG